MKLYEQYLQEGPLTAGILAGAMIVGGLLFGKKIDAIIQRREVLKKKCKNLSGDKKEICILNARIASLKQQKNLILKCKCKPKIPPQKCKQILKTLAKDKQIQIDELKAQLKKYR